MGGKSKVFLQYSIIKVILFYSSDVYQKTSIKNFVLILGFRGRSQDRIHGLFIFSFNKHAWILHFFHSKSQVICCPTKDWTVFPLNVTGKCGQLSLWESFVPVGPT